METRTVRVTLDVTFREMTKAEFAEADGNTFSRRPPSVHDYDIQDLTEIFADGFDHCADEMMAGSMVFLAVDRMDCVSVTEPAALPADNR